jgi:hypothetical protein
MVRGSGARAVRHRVLNSRSSRAPTVAGGGAPGHRRSLTSRGRVRPPSHNRRRQPPACARTGHRPRTARVQGSLGACDRRALRVHAGRQPRPASRPCGDRPVVRAARLRRDSRAGPAQGSRQGVRRRSARRLSQSGRPAARRATADAQAVCWKPVKHPGMGVLHDFPRGDAGLRHT